MENKAINIVKVLTGEYWPIDFEISEKEAKKHLEVLVKDDSASIARARIKKIGDLTLNIAIITDSVAIHVHRTGKEFYKIVSGSGEMHTAFVPKNTSSIKKNEISLVEVQKGDVILIPENYAHMLKNTCKNPLIILFICPQSHLQDDGDREFVEVDF